ncbi:30S ribosomal protein S5 [Patescibacteria group bacterium]|nr:30S ribosomal protein S5 [Patescibacteria group bacterium]
MPRRRRIKSRPLPGVRTEPEFTQQLVDLARVTRVVKGGKRLSFRACIAIGNHKGEVGIGVAKGADVAMAIEKAVRQANKSLIKVPIVNNTIPHWVKVKYGAARVLLRPAKKGHGIVAGGAVRTVLSLTGIRDITAKILGSKSKINNVKATIKALKSLKTK